MRTAVFALIALVSSALPAAADALYEKLDQDSNTSRALNEGRKILQDYLKAEEELRNPKQRRASYWEQKKLEARKEFMAWLAITKEKLGVDLTSRPSTVIALFDDARASGRYFNTRFKRGRMDYVEVEDPRGMRRLEYALLVPKSYKAREGRLPGVVSMHGRVIDLEHPAFRGNAKRFQEKSRQVVYDYWAKSPAGESAIVVAPTGISDGFKFNEDRHFDDLQMLFRVLGELLTNYRVDWQRVFLEVHGEAFRVCCEQTFMFAGLIVRDRKDDRRRPFIDPEQYFMLENLNGTPLVYVADEAYWDNVGKPFAEALEAAYKNAGAPQNLVVMKSARDANGALKGDERKIAEFVEKHRRPPERKSFKWRYFRPTMETCLPVQLKANFNYGDAKAVKFAALEKKAGALNFNSSIEYYEDDEGEKKPYNRVVINATEAESAQLFLMPGQINFDAPLTVVVNGKTILDRKEIEYDWDLFWEVTVPRRFFMIPVFGMQELAFEHVPQFVPEEPEKTGEEGATEEEEGAEEESAGGDDSGGK